MADTRRDRRAPVALKVRFKSATLDEFFEQYAQDISKGGAFIKAKRPMAVGTLLKFEFRLQDDSSIIRGVGRVVWCRTPEEADAERPAGMGIKFIKMDPESRSLVERIVNERGGKPGRFDQADDRPTAAGPAPGGESKPFFPETTPQEELPPPEERTVVRHASEFLAQALADIDEEAAAEAKARAEEAERRVREREEAARRAAQQEETKPEVPAEASEAPGEAKEAPEEGAPSADEAEASPEPAGQTEPEEAAEAPPVEERAATGETPPPATAAEPPAGKPPAAAGPTASSADVESQREVPTEPPAEPARPAAQASAEPEGSEGSPLVWVLAVAAVAAIGYLGWQATRSEQPPTAPEETAAAGGAKPPEAPGVARQAPPAEPTKAEAPAAGLAPAGVAAKPPEDQAKEAPGGEQAAGGEGAEGVGARAPTGVPGAGAAQGGEAPDAQPPAMVSARIVTRPPGATVRVDGEERGEAPLQIDLPEGREVLVEAKLPGHRPVSQRWTPGPGETRLRLGLAPLPVIVAVRSEPPGARVRIEGQRVTAPGEVTLPARPTRPVRLVATLDGHRRTVVKVEPSAFQERGEALRAEVTVKLEPKPAPSARQGARPAGQGTSRPSSAAPAGDSGGSSAPGGSAPDSEEPPPERRPEPSPPPAREEPSPPAGGGGGGAEPIPDNPF